MYTRSAIQGRNTIHIGLTSHVHPYNRASRVPTFPPVQAPSKSPFTNKNLVSTVRSLLSPEIRNFLVSTLSHTLPPNPYPKHHNLVSLPLIHLTCPPSALILDLTHFFISISRKFGLALSLPSSSSPSHRASPMALLFASCAFTLFAVGVGFRSGAVCPFCDALLPLNFKKSVVEIVKIGRGEGV